MASKLYTGGALFFGLVSAGATMVGMHPGIKKIAVTIANMPQQKTETYDQFCEGSGLGDDGNSCATRILGRALSYPAYGVRCLGDYENARNVGAAAYYLTAQGVLGVVSGTVVGVTWPISVPLIALEIAESKYGYKLC